ncbi:GGDEF domain-containing protein [Mangrovitalea sediminis]|uniref:GGDEF domain-containing protein n=1 Tax=Mangrovitalea sediminis TaxID=1982043 RepID=UPI000BE5EE32|nr:GGDEF domain-containing protein [Mangrovitalea sediminis]
MRYSSLGVGSTNPTETILGYQRQIVYHIHFWTLMVVAPLFAIQLGEGHTLLSLLLALFCLNALAVIVMLRRYDLYLFQGRSFSLFAAACTVYSTYLNGHIGLFWAYPSITAFFFLLSMREATALNLVFLGSMIIVSYYRFPEDEFWRITFSLTLTGVFVSIFAWLVGRMQSELTIIASTDPLTGCLNRAQMEHTLQMQKQLHERYGRPASIILLDLDHFKAINDEWGHVKGDELLRASAVRLQKHLRDSDRLFRVGGEEFLVVLPETDAAAAEAVAGKLLDVIRSPAFDDDIQVTASAGVAEVHRGECNSAWLNRADKALYNAKDGGRDRVLRAPQPAAGTPSPQPG